MSLQSLLGEALGRRQELLTRLSNEKTDCYRLFHGTNEGIPGLTVDRYGPLLLIQSFHNQIETSELAVIKTMYQELFEPAEVVYHDRSKSVTKPVETKPPHSENPHQTDYIGHEIGVSYRVRGRHAGQDPLLFLDMRAGRRWMLEQAAGKSVLNLFAYTCGLGVCATLAGASEVWNIDFAARNLAVGQENADLNALAGKNFRLIKSDYFTAVRQLAGLPVSQRRQQAARSYLRLEARCFDRVFLDPPRWAKSPFGTVDLIRDYPSVLKPALLATAPGGILVCSNNVASVALDDWLEIIRRCAVKAGRTPEHIEILTPESDFPSPDGQYPLKLAVLQL